MQSSLFHTHILSCPRNLTEQHWMLADLYYPIQAQRRKANRCSSCHIWSPGVHQGFGQILWKGNPAYSATWRFLAYLCANTCGQGCVTSSWRPFSTSTLPRGAMMALQMEHRTEWRKSLWNSNQAQISGVPLDQSFTLPFTSILNRC